MSSQASREFRLAYIALMAAFIAVLRFVPAIPMPIGVPITAQSLGIMLAGTLLGARFGFLAVLLFVFLAILGLPVLASGITGLAIFEGPTVGFVLGFPIAAYVTGWLMQRMHSSLFISAAFSSFIGCILVLYFLGVLGLVINTKLDFTAATIAMAPFLIGDFIKAILAGFITETVGKLRPQFVLSR